MTTLWQDVVYGFRMLLKKPGFTAIAALSLALGIGANTAIFSLVNTVLLNSLAYRDPSRLVMIETTPPGHPETTEGAMVTDYFAWKEQSRSFEGVGVVDIVAHDFGVEENGNAAERIEGEAFSPAVFQILGVRPILGRIFTEEEDPIGTPAPVMLISYRLWQRRYASDPNIAGKTVHRGRDTVTIIGVMPPDFHFTDENAQFWEPVFINRFQLQGSAPYLYVVARLKPGVAITQAQEPHGVRDGAGIRTGLDRLRSPQISGHRRGFAHRRRYGSEHHLRRAELGGFGMVFDQPERVAAQTFEIAGYRI